MWLIDRKKASTIYRQCTGRCGLCAHLSRLHLTDPFTLFNQPPAHISQDCPLFTSQRNETWPDYSTHPAGLFPLHSPEEPGLARRSRPQHQDPNTHPARLFPLHSPEEPDLAAVWPNPSTHPAGLSPLHSPEESGLTRRGRPQHRDPSTHPAGLFPLHSPEEPGLARGCRPQHQDPSTHPARLFPLHSPEKPDLATVL